MHRLSIKYALIACIVLIMWVMLEHEFGFNTEKHHIGEYTRLASAFLFYLFIFLCIRERRRIQNGQISFAQGVRSGGLMVALYSLLSTFWMAAYSKLINPALYPSLLTYRLKKLEDQQAGLEEITATSRETTLMYGGSLPSFVLYALFCAAMGMLMTVLFSILLKARKK